MPIMDIEELENKIIEFRDARDWAQKNQKTPAFALRASAFAEATAGQVGEARKAAMFKLEINE
jgi:hypothetical protein